MNVHRNAYETPVTSPAQDRSWYLHHLVPESAEQNHCRQYAVVGSLDLAAVRRAWSIVSGRHEILRTVYREVDGFPVPEVRPDADAALRIVDLRTSWSWPDSEEVADQLVAGWVATPFHPGTGLISATVVVLTDTRARLLLLADAMICDEESVGIIARDVAAAYVAGGADRQQGGTVDTLQYRTVAECERGQSIRRSAETRTPDWVSALGRADDPLDLPSARGRPQDPPLASGRACFDWPPAFGALMNRAAVDAGVDQPVVLLAAFHALLYRYDRAARVAIAVPASTRTATTRDVVGPFSNPVVVYVEFEEAPTVRQLLETVQRQLRDGLRHRNVPFDHIVRMAGVDCDPRRSPLYDAVFVCRAEPAEALDLGDARMLPVSVDSGVPQADLCLRIDRLEPSVAGSVRYRTDMFDHASAARIAAQLRTFVEAAVERLDDPIDAIRLERHDELLAAVRDADRIEDVVVTPVHDVVDERARRSPDALAVAGSSTSTTYRELRRRAAAAAAALREAAGALQLDGKPVALRIAPSASFAAAALAVLQTGAHLVCFGTDDAGERDRVALRGLEPVCLFVDTAAGRPGDGGFAAWYRDECGGTVIDLAALAVGEPVADLGRRPTVDPAAPAYVAYTSGSTGVPKGIVQSHAAMAQFTGWFAAEFGISPGVRVAQWAAPGYDASLMELFATLTAGGTLCPVPDDIRGNPDKMIDWLAAERVAVFQTVPSFAREIRRALTAGAALPHLRVLLLAGEALPGVLANHLRALLPSIRLVNLYGPTETILATWHEITGDVVGTVPIGRSIPGRHVLVLDQADRPCPVGVTGDLVIRSPFVTPGYVGVETRPARLFPEKLSQAGFGVGPGPYYRTGDRARRRWDGDLEFRGRADLQIKFFGRRLELADLEAVLAEHETVADCAVLPVGDREGLVTRMVAYVVPRTGPGTPPATADVWRAHVRRRFGRAKLPLSFRIVDRLPRTAGGKVDRRRLPKPATVVSRAEHDTQSVTEAALGTIWRRLLDCREVTGEDTFVGVGGHSLLLLRLGARIRHRFGVRITLWHLATNPTLTDLAAAIDAATEVVIPDRNPPRPTHATYSAANRP